jgi:hypothetical protein
MEHTPSHTLSALGTAHFQAMAAFDTNTELWTGRVAMLGVLGLVAAELVKGDSLF